MTTILTLFFLLLLQKDFDICLGPFLPLFFFLFRKIFISFMCFFSRLFFVFLIFVYHFSINKKLYKNFLLVFSIFLIFFIRFFFIKILFIRISFIRIFSIRIRRNWYIINNILRNLFFFNNILIFF